MPSNCFTESYYAIAPSNDIANLESAGRGNRFSTFSEAADAAIDMDGTNPLDGDAEWIPVYVCHTGRVSLA